jgi:hypothetical protein
VNQDEKDDHREFKNLCERRCQERAVLSAWEQQKSGGLAWKRRVEARFQGTTQFNHLSVSPGVEETNEPSPEVMG